MNYAQERRELLIRYLVRVAITAEYLTANQLRVIHRVIHELEKKIAALTATKGFDFFMKLAQEFKSVSDVARIGNADDVEIRYSVFVGDPDLKFSFLDSERFICEDFTNYRDACNALELVKRTLELVDESLAQGLKLSDVRDEIIANLNRATTGNLISKREAQRAINKIFNYYISHED